MNDIMKIIQALEDSDILIKGVTKTTKNETKEQKQGFLRMLLGTLGASLLGNLLKGYVGTHWIALFCKKNGNEMELSGNKNIKANIF